MLINSNIKLTCRGCKWHGEFADLIHSGEFDQIMGKLRCPHCKKLLVEKDLKDFDHRLVEKNASVVVPWLL